MRKTRISLRDRSGRYLGHADIYKNKISINVPKSVKSELKVGNCDGLPGCLHFDLKRED